ncbi:Probable inorganic pyrophosphatase 1 [Galdieria sulphuraria]|nr:Probable inorganic pyrophosphatase 1 [Galdieria sulphuraria]
MGQYIGWFSILHIVFLGNCNKTALAVFYEALVSKNSAVYKSFGTSSFLTKKCSRNTSFFKAPYVVFHRLTVRLSHDSTYNNVAVDLQVRGQPNSLEYRLFFSHNQKRISPWHDIPLFHNEKERILNFVNEIPRGETGKYEIATKEHFNPIRQDVKNGALRFYKYGPSLINYGAFPQTWEDPKVVDPETGFGGDNDPLDVLEIGSETLKTGGVYQVKPLGALALIDGGETDWKIFAIRTDDKDSSRIHDLGDVERVYPGVLDKVKEWFRLYKTAEGKGENKYGYQGQYLDKEKALKVIRECHEAWKQLRAELSSQKELV